MFYIYRITNLVNGKTYIGQHKYKKLNDRYMGSGIALVRAQKKYGIENFKKEILVFNILKAEHANILEETFIASEREKVGRENCYNITNGGDGFKGLEPWNKGKPAWNKGRKATDEEIRKNRESHKGQPGYWKGKHFLEEHKKKISEAKKGRRQTEEEKRKQSEAQRGKHWYNNGKINRYCYECPPGFVLGMLR